MQNLQEGTNDSESVVGKLLQGFLKFLLDSNSQNCMISSGSLVILCLLVVSWQVKRAQTCNLDQK